MKLLIALYLLAFVTVINAQSSGNQNPVLFTKIKFEVPESPAFSLLTAAPSNVLRPSGINDLNLNASDFLNSENSLTLPSTFGIEFSPVRLLMGQNLTIRDYQKYHILINTKLSFGTHRKNNSGNAAELSVGLRTTLSNNADSLLNQVFLDQLTEGNQAEREIFREMLGANYELNGEDLINEIRNSEEFKEKFKKRYSDKIQERYKVHWNHNISEAAVAVKFVSADSLAKNLKYELFSLWFAVGRALGNWGQILFNLNIMNKKDSLTGGEFVTSQALNTRLYAGVYSFRMMAELQWKVMKNSLPEAFANLGMEFKIPEYNLWVELSAGYASNFNGVPESFVHKFNLKYGL